MQKANGLSIRRQQAIECRVTLCSANQHQTDAVPLSRRGSASRNLLPTNLLAGELEKNAPTSTSRTTRFMVSNRLTHKNTSPHLGQPFFQKQFVTPRYSQIYRTNHDPFSLTLASESVWSKNAHDQRSLTSTCASHVASCTRQLHCTKEIARIASDQTASIRESLRDRAAVRVHHDQRFDQLRNRYVAFAAAPSGATDAVTVCRSIGDGARFIAFSNTRFSSLVFEYSFSKPCSNIFEYSNNRFSTESEASFCSHEHDEQVCQIS